MTAIQTKEDKIDALDSLQASLVDLNHLLREETDEALCDAIAATDEAVAELKNQMIRVFNIRTIAA